MSIRDQIVAFIKGRDHVTFVELQNEFKDVMNVRGKYVLECCKNGTLWANMSKEFSELVDSLIKDKTIHVHPTDRLVYILDGGALSLPVPKNPPKDGVHVGYEQPVWIPSCLRLKPYDAARERFIDLMVRRQEMEKEKAGQHQIAKMIKYLGRDQVDKAFHKVMDGDTRKQWSLRYGLKEAKDPVCAMRLLGKKCAGRYPGDQTDQCACQPPGSDHETLWSYKNKPVVYVFQPYGLGGETIEELFAYCQKWGFRTQIDTWPAWHYPGHILFVELYVKGGLYEELKKEPPGKYSSDGKGES